MPVHPDGVLYTNRGYSGSPYLAVVVGGQGDVSETHIRWRHPTGAPYISSLVYHEGLVYMATENGILIVTDAETGDVVWRERLGGVFTASPVVAGGRVYFLSEDGVAEPEPPRFYFLSCAANSSGSVVGRSHTRFSHT